MAVAFLKSFPIASSLTADEFDQWASTSGYYQRYAQNADGQYILPDPGNRKSLEWSGHVKYRCRLRELLNKGAAHPSMRTPFVVVGVHEEWRVQAVEEVLADDKVIRAVDTFVQNKRRSVNQLLQCVRVDRLSPSDRMRIEVIHQDINQVRQMVRLALDNVDRKFLQIEKNLKHLERNPPDGDEADK